MRATIGVLVAVLCAASCKQAAEKKQAKPGPEAKVAEAAPAGEVTVTTRSPEARAAFEKGRELTDKIRGAESVEHFQKALELDPDFALARAYLGVVTPGPAGVTQLDKAVEQAANLPEAERLAIQARQLDRAGKGDESFAAYVKVAELAPGDWRTHFIVGTQQTRRGDAAAAIATFEKLKKLKPDLAEVYNGLAYAHAALRQWDPAIEAAQKQVELLPGEPNPHDTLGEMLLLAGRFEEAEKAFNKATIDPKFAGGWQGVALARAYRGDLDGAAAAFLNQQGAAQSPNDRVGAALDEAWVYWMQKKRDKAYAVLDKLDADPTVKTSPNFTFVAMDRGHLLQDEGKYAQAAKAYADGKARGAEQQGFARLGAERGYAIGTLRSAMLARKKPGEAEDAALAALEAEAARLPEEKGRQSYAAWGRGLHAWAKGDARAAAAELANCGPEHMGCRLDLVNAQRAAGDAAAADATAKEILARPLRDVTVVWVWSKLAGAK